jgi:hypothetical protein
MCDLRQTRSGWCSESEVLSIWLFLLSDYRVRRTRRVHDLAPSAGDPGAPDSRRHVIQAIDNGMGLLSLSAGAKFAVTGLVLFIAAAVDALSRRGRTAAGLG